jgi:dethiobiotin synthetase
MSKNYFITGIGTNVGKTVASAVLTEALKADYWKPVQCGIEGGRDVEFVASLVSNPRSKFLNETYLFKEPASPHKAAGMENITIDFNSIKLPSTNNTLIIEGAGGPLVPLNDRHYVIELAKSFNSEVILVVTDYLGCINHSLLCIDYLISHNYNFAGVILNGNFDPEVEKAILNYKPVKVLGRIAHTENVSKEFIVEQVKNIIL